MNEIKKLVVGETTESVVRFLFDHRIAEESKDTEFNTAGRALRIKDLKAQLMGFIKRNPNSIFEIYCPEYKTDKNLVLKFANFINDEDDDDDDSLSAYRINIQDNFIEAEVIKKVQIGKDIVLRIKAM